MAKTSLNSMKALLCISAALIATNCLAGQDIFKNTNPGQQEINPASSAVIIAEKNINFKVVHIFSVYHKAMMDKNMLAEFEGLRSNTNIIPSITLAGLSASEQAKIVELHFNAASPDSQILNNRSILLKSKDKTPAFFQDDNIISNLSMNSVAQARAMPESMLDSQRGDSHATVQCLVTINASLLGKEHAVYKNVFAKSLSHMSAEQIDSVVAQFIVRHENAHCAQTGELHSTLALNTAGFAKEINKDFASPYNQKFFHDIQGAVKEHSADLKKADYNSKMENWVKTVKLFKSRMPEKISEAYADGVAMMSLYSQGLVNIQTIKDFAAERTRAATADNDLDHDTSSLLNSLAEKIENRELVIPQDAKLKDITKVFTPIWQSYAGAEEVKVGLTDKAKGSFNVEGKPASANNNISTVTSQPFKGKLADKIAKVRALQELEHSGHNHAPGFKH